MNTTLTFQEIIQKLNAFWAEQGCIIAQPYGVEVGAGTANPHTFFRVLGPEPYSVAYVEPSRRPTDGRYGKNPNRLQHYYQYQVIIKPAPKFNQEMYIESLKVLGIDPEQHDIRFVEDNWESTPLGAWGLGWEVWLNGMEVSQYTYFQQVAGIQLDVPALEITYGLERLAMYIQNVEDYRDIKWNDSVTYGEVFERHEFWQATHNYETASIDTLRQLFDLYEKEVKVQLEKENFWAAYDYLLKMSHTFNLLDSRGVISLSDRVAKFAVMAKYSKMVGKLYIAERETLLFPLKNNVSQVSFSLPQKRVAAPKDEELQNVAVVELGFEELPASYLAEWSETLNDIWLRDQFTDAKFNAGIFGVRITPRRIIITLINPDAESVTIKRVQGPPLAKCYEDGKPTKALQGFLAKNNATEKDLLKDTIFAVLEVKETVTLEDILQKVVTELIATAPKTKWMRWDEQTDAFIRPLRWIVAYHNNKKMNIVAFNVVSDNKTYSPRYTHSTEVLVNSAQEYIGFLGEYDIIASQFERKDIITSEAFGKVTKSEKFDHYVTQNMFLTESPKLHTEILPARYHELPPELIKYILEKNQMYLLTQDTNDIFYTIIANQRKVHPTIIEGNKRVVKARLEDGLFYMNQDKNVKLADLRETLKKINFHPKAGSYFDKTGRIAKIVDYIRSKVNLEVDEKALTTALQLIKNDKASNLAKEFPSLEGTIGSFYARREDYEIKVCEILKDHYEVANSSVESGLISIADKADSLVTLTAFEKLPEGSHDPYELRKTAYNFIRTVLAFNQPLEVKEVLEFAASLVETEERVASVSDILTFLKNRFEQIVKPVMDDWIAQGISDADSSNLVELQRIGIDIQQSYGVKIKESLLDSLKRVTNIIKKSSEDIQNLIIDESILETKGEKDLFAFTVEFETAAASHGVNAEHFMKLTQILEQFFTDTIVMDPNLTKRQNRIGLLARLSRGLQQMFHIDYN
jgi:glycyl-tRNA synthetase